MAAQAQLRPERKKIRRKRRKRPGDPKYTTPINGNLHWQPNKRLRELGFRNVACGPDGPEARAIAEDMNRRAIVQRAIDDALGAVMAAPRGGSYLMLGAWSHANAAELQRSEFEKFESQTVPRQPPVRIQTPPPANWLKWLLG